MAKFYHEENKLYCWWCKKKFQDGDEKKTSNKKIFHKSCWNRKNGVNRRQIKKASNPVGNFK